MTYLENYQKGLRVATQKGLPFILKGFARNWRSNFYFILKIITSSYQEEKPEIICHRPNNELTTF